MTANTAPWSAIDPDRTFTFVEFDPETLDYLERPVKVRTLAAMVGGNEADVLAMLAKLEKRGIVERMRPGEYRVLGDRSSLFPTIERQQA